MLPDIEQVASINDKVKVLTGAGVKTAEDVKKAIELGTYRVLLASGAVKAEDPKKVMLSLAGAL